jgi:hypothetical protein
MATLSQGVNRACALMLVAFVEHAAPHAAAAQHLSIPFLANASRPAALEFEAGECDIDASGRSMICRFQQLFLTTADAAPNTCLVTTNGYERRFEKQGATDWVSREGPDGDCGIVDVATLRDNGGVRWTMEMRKIVTRRDASARCRAADEAPETLSWQNVRRELPCRFVQPGALRP